MLGVLLLVVAVALEAPLARAAGPQVTYISGTCIEAETSYNISTFINEAAVAASGAGAKCSASANPSANLNTPEWDLGKDGAFANYSILYCCLDTGSYCDRFGALKAVIEEKGFRMTYSCNMAGLLSFPKYAVFVMMDTGTQLSISDADALAIRNFYMAGGGVFATTDNCPYLANANKMFDTFPAPFKGFRLRYNDGHTGGMRLSCGNPLDYNSFGYHVVYTGIASMTAGHSLSIPTYFGNYGVGPFAVMGTTAIPGLSDCGGCEPYCGGTPPSGTHAVQMYVDPLVQLVNVTNSSCWGRIVVDSGWTRYFHPSPERYGTSRFGVNIVVWLVNIDKYFSAGKSECPGSPPPLVKNTTSNNATNNLQVMGCSSGDAITLAAGEVPPCGISFAGANAPKCLAIVVGDNGTTCIVSLRNADVGSYWILVDGQNSSLQFAVTASSLAPRGSVDSATFPCVRNSAQILLGCKDGATVVIDWTLPGAIMMTLGVVSKQSVCSSFLFVGTKLTCTFANLWNLTRGTYQTYVNGVSTGISMQVASDKLPPKSKRCSDTATFSSTEFQSVTRTPSISQHASFTESLTVPISASATESEDATPTVSLTRLTASPTGSVSRTPSASRTPSSSRSPTPTKSMTPSQSLTLTHETVTVTDSLAVTWTSEETPSPLLTLTDHVTETPNSFSRTGSVTVTHTVTPRVTPSASLTVTRVIPCIQGASIRDAMALLLHQSLELTQADVVGGYELVTTLVSEPSLMNASLYLWWFVPLRVNVTVTVVAVAGLAENADGFKTYGAAGGSEGGGPPANASTITVFFPDGLVSTAEPPTDSIVVQLTMPPMPGYRIEAEEKVVLSMRTRDVTYAPLCNGTAAGAAPGDGDLLLPLFELTVYPPAVSSAITSSVVSSLAPIGAALAAPQLTVLVMTSMLPCSSSYARGALANYRALAPAAISDSFEGVVIGNLILTLGCCGAWTLVAWALAMATKTDFLTACARIRHPALPIIVYFLTFPGTSFAAMQLMTGPDTAGGSYALAGFAIVLVVLAAPMGAMHYIRNHLEMDFAVFEYARWHRNSSPAAARFLNVLLLPVGTWSPPHLRQMLWMFVTRQCRKEYLWLTLPMWSPLVVACLGVIRPGSLLGCAVLFGVLAFLHVAIALVVVWCRPLQSTLEDFIFVGQTLLTATILSFSASLLLLPASAALRAGLAVLAFCIVIVTAIDVVYNVVLNAIILPRLHEHVPHAHAFAWPNVAEDDAEGGRDGPCLFDLHGDDLGEELVRFDDDPLEAREADDAFLDALMLQQGEPRGGEGGPAPADADAFLDDMLLQGGTKEEVRAGRAE